MSGPSRSRRLGQNFLIDRRAVLRIVDLLAPERDEPVLEIGPGRGALTAVLLERVRRLAAVEVDPRLAHALRQRWPDERLLVLEQDVLELDPTELAARLGYPDKPPMAWVGNLPYSISKPVALRLVRWRETVARAVLMFQREVAERLTAGPGSKAYGPMSVLTGQTFRIRRCFDLPPGAFRPAPEIVSTVTHWTPRSEPSLTAQDELRLRACLAVAFGRRRKTLRNNFLSALGSAAAADRLLALSGIEGTRRAESVTPEEFRRLASHWPRQDG